MPDDLGAETPYPQVDQQPDYPLLEDRVLAFWAKDGTFAASVAARPGGTTSTSFTTGRLSPTGSPTTAISSPAS
jgi:hypothetical protein